jgi:hypothetical protein
MKNLLSISRLFFLALLLCVAGCANFAAVKGYAEQTTKLTASFRPMLAGSVSECEGRYRRKALYTNSQYNFEQVQQEAGRLCSPIKTANKVIEPLNTLLGTYAETLLALSDNALPSYKGQIVGLSNSLASFKQEDGTPAINAQQLGAITSLAEFVSRAATQRIQANALREALDHHASIKIISEVLKDYATRNYGGYLDDQLREFPSLLYAVRSYGKTETLTSRYLENQLFSERETLNVKKEAVMSYSTALDKMVLTHLDLSNNINNLSATERFRILASYAQEVYSLQSKFSEAF